MVEHASTPARQPSEDAIPGQMATEDRDGLHCVYGRCRGLPYGPGPCHPGCSFTMRAKVPSWMDIAALPQPGPDLERTVRVAQAALCGSLTVLEQPTVPLAEYERAVQENEHLRSVIEDLRKRLSDFEGGIADAG